MNRIADFTLSLFALAAAAIIGFMLVFGTGCTTVNCSLQSGERNTVKSDQDQQPSTPISTTATIPFK